MLYLAEFGAALINIYLNLATISHILEFGDRMARGRWQRTDESVEDTLELGGTRAEVACYPRWRRVARHVEGVVGQAASGGGSSQRRAMSALPVGAKDREAELPGLCGVSRGRDVRLDCGVGL